MGLVRVPTQERQGSIAIEAGLTLSPLLFVNFGLVFGQIVLSGLTFCKGGLPQLRLSKINFFKVITIGINLGGGLVMNASVGVKVDFLVGNELFNL